MAWKLLTLDYQQIGTVSVPDRDNLGNRTHRIVTVPETFPMWSWAMDFATRFISGNNWRIVKVPD